MITHDELRAKLNDCKSIEQVVAVKSGFVDGIDKKNKELDDLRNEIRTLKDKEEVLDSEMLSFHFTNTENMVARRMYEIVFRES